jgi:hypothetical protein
MSLAAAGMASAQGTPPAGGGGKGVPAEAFASCKSRAENDACPITTPEGDKISGSCVMTPKKKLACMPEGGPRAPN